MVGHTAQPFLPPLYAPLTVTRTLTPLRAGGQRPELRHPFLALLTRWPIDEPQGLLSLGLRHGCEDVRHALQFVHGQPSPTRSRSSRDATGVISGTGHLRFSGRDTSRHLTGMYGMNFDHMPELH